MNLINTTMLRNHMTLATDLNYTFFTDTICYKGYYCLSSVAMVKEEIPSLNLRAGQTVITSPRIDENAINGNCTIYKAIDIDAESGLLIPIISWALEFTKHIVSLDIPVYMESNGLIEILLMQIWKYEDVTLSEKGLHINLQNPMSWKPITERKIRWDDYDSLAHAEILLKNGVTGLKEDPLPHAHTENIIYFRKMDVSKGVIFDW